MFGGGWALAVCAMAAAQIIEEVQEPLCGTVRVIEHADVVANGEGPATPVVTRFLTCNATAIGAAYVEPEHARAQIVYTAMIVQAASAWLYPVPRRALCLGLGAGAVPRALRTRRGIEVDVVERSAAVVALAARHFALAPADGRDGAGRTVLADAGSLLASPHADPRTALDVGVRGLYDLVVADLFDGVEAAPAVGAEACDAHGANDLASHDQLLALRAHWLAPRGALVVNVVSGLGAASGPMGSPARRVAAQLARAFAHVRAFADHEPTAAEADLDASASPPEACNVIFFASDAPVEFVLPDSLRRAAAEAADGSEAAVLAGLERWELVGLGSGAGWAHREPLSAASAREGAALAAASMSAVQARTLPASVAELMRRPSRQRHVELTETEMLQ